MVSVKVPATSANVGAGFDSLGLAVTLYNELHLEEYDGIMIQSLDGVQIPADETNLVYQTMRELYARCGKPFRGAKIGQVNRIPLSRGLGSSSACIVGGLLGANLILGEPMSRIELLNLAASMEGHPDNVAPALLGGFVAAVFDGKKVHCVKQPLHEDLKFAAVIPDFELKTSLARSVLPKEVRHADAVFNLSRAALMSASLTTGSYQNLRVAADDRLHQNHRLSLIKGSDVVMKLMEDLGAYCSYISGAGSTLMAIVPGADGAFEGKLRKGLDESGFPGWRLLMLDADNTGAVCVESRTFD